MAFNRTVVLRYRIHVEQLHDAQATINLDSRRGGRIGYKASDAALLLERVANNGAEGWDIGGLIISVS